MKIAFSRDVTQCILEGIYRLSEEFVASIFREIEVQRWRQYFFSETSVNLSQATRRHIPEDDNLNIRN